jgi:hypothetical protein
MSEGSAPPDMGVDDKESTKEADIGDLDLKGGQQTEDEDLDIELVCASSGDDAGTKTVVSSHCLSRPRELQAKPCQPRKGKHPWQKKARALANHPHQIRQG